MQDINTETDLRVAILQLEARQAEEGKFLKEHSHLVYESIKPINLIKSTFREVTSSNGLKGNILSTSVGMTAGVLSKMVFQGLMRNPVKKILGTVLMFGIENVVAKNPNAVKSLGKGLFNIGRKLIGSHQTRAI